MLKRFIFVLCFCLHTVVFAGDPVVDFVQNLTDDIIENVLVKKMSKEDRLAEFKKEFTAALDLRSIGQFVLGRYWKTSDKKTQDDFLTAFVDFATQSWADKFDLYTGQDIQFTGVRTAAGNQYYVNSQIMNNPPVEVVWRVREKNGAYRIVDIVVEGVSMAMSYRSEYASFLQQKGGDVSALTAELIQKTADLQKTQGKESK